MRARSLSGAALALVLPAHRAGHLGGIRHGVRMILARRTRAGLGGSTPPQGIVALGEGQAGRGSAWRGRPPRRAAPEQGLAPDPGRGALRRTWRRWRTRRLIVTLDEHVLKDIGASRAEALAEYSKPFWRA